MTRPGAWEEWKERWGKSYSSPEEEQRRHKVFNANALEAAIATVVESVGESGMDAVIYDVSGRWSDQTQEEWNPEPLEVPRWIDEEEGNYMEEPIVELPEAFDWRDEHAITTVIGDTGECVAGSYAFAVAGVMGGQAVLQGKKKRDEAPVLSPQQLIDCSRTHCAGGWPFDALDDIASSCKSELATEWNYPWTGESSGSCAWKKGTKDSVKFESWSRAPTKDPEGLASFMMRTGPMSVTFNGSWLKSYKGGVAKPRVCPRVYTYSALLVGFGTSEKGDLFWIVKPSLGKDFGEDGYARIVFGKCSVSNMAIFTIGK